MDIKKMNPNQFKAILFVFCLGWVPLNSDLRFDCMRRHLSEASQINTERLPRYSLLTHGQSESISRKLITLETWGTYTAFWLFDWGAQFYQMRDIRVLCDEFVSMSTVPFFVEWRPFAGAVPASYESIQVGEIKREISRAFHGSGFEGVSMITLGYLDQLVAYPDFHCMVRHLLESIERSSRLAPSYVELAKTQGLESPVWLSWRFIWTQLELLPLAEQLDREAFPIQIQGIPLICQDVPKIK